MYLRPTLLSTLALACTLLATPAAAEPQSRPNGPWVQESQHLSLKGFHSYDELITELRSIEQSSQGRVRLEAIGATNEGRPLYVAQAGSGARRIMYITQQHGNEPHGSEAALHALRTLGSSNHPDVLRILDQLTVLMVVRANPDGTERYWRQNYDPDCDTRQSTCLPGRGYDINRWHDPRISDTSVPVPEALAIRQAHRMFRPELVVDYHGQLTYVSSDGNMITTSVLWPMFPSSVPVTAERQAAIQYSKRISRLMYDTLEQYGHAEVTLYPASTTMGTARNAYGYLGSASVLFEQRADAGQKSIGMLVRQAYVTMLEIARSVADNSITSIDPALAEDIPPRGPRIRDPHEEHEH